MKGVWGVFESATRGVDLQLPPHFAAGPDDARVWGWGVKGVWGRVGRDLLAPLEKCEAGMGGARVPGAPVPRCIIGVSLSGFLFVSDGTPMGDLSNPRPFTAAPGS